MNVPVKLNQGSGRVQADSIYPIGQEQRHLCNQNLQQTQIVSYVLQPQSHCHLLRFQLLFPLFTAKS